MNAKYHYGVFPPTLVIHQEIISLVHLARTALGRYDGFLSSMTNPELLLSPLFTQEAVLSSRIEGTQSTLTDVLKFEANDKTQEISESNRNDILEILSYRGAMEKARKLLENHPLSQRVLLGTHKALMKGGVRGKNKGPGMYRKIPVWIGSDQSNMEHARFIPIDAQHIHEAMTKFENFIHRDSHYDDFVKIAILHAEFESIHPFLDGNGRIGRLLIPLYLWQKKLLSSPSFYISTYFEKNKDSYYDLLLNVSKKNDWLTWISFFMKGVIEQAKDNYKRAEKINTFYRSLKEKIPQITKSPYGITALDYIFKKNYFNAVTFYKDVQIPRPTAYRLLTVFTEKNILYCPNKGKGRNSNFYIFKELIDIADGR